MKIHFTAAADLLYDPDAERLHGPPTGLEHFFNESGTEKIYLTTDEREAFEQEGEGDRVLLPPLLDSDVLDDALFLNLKTWLEEDLVTCDKTDAPTVGRGSAEPPPIRLVIHLDGGLVQDVVSNVPIEYIVADTDIEGCDEEERQAVPPLLKKHIHEAEMFQTSRNESSVDAPAIEEIFQ